MECLWSDVITPADWMFYGHEVQTGSDKMACGCECPCELHAQALVSILLGVSLLSRACITCSLAHRLGRKHSREGYADLPPAGGCTLLRVLAGACSGAHMFSKRHQTASSACAPAS